MTMLRTDHAGRVLTARMSNPPRNFMTGRMVAELDELIGRADEDASISAVVLTGAMDGPGHSAPRRQPTAPVACGLARGQRARQVSPRWEPWCPRAPRSEEISSPTSTGCTRR